MPIQKQDRRTQWTLDLPDDQWELARNATIKVTDQHGIYEATTGSDIEVNGDVEVRGEGYAGVRFMGSNSTLAIGRDAMIEARDGADGVFAEGAGQSIVNRGLITAGEFGIRGAIWGEVKNFGTISADHGFSTKEPVRKSPTMAVSRLMTASTCAATTRSSTSARATRSSSAISTAATSTIPIWRSAERNWHARIALAARESPTHPPSGRCRRQDLSR